MMGFVRWWESVSDKIPPLVMMNKLVVQPVSFQKYSNLGSIESTVMFYVPQTGEEQQLVLGQARQFSQNYQQEGTLLCRGTPIPGNI